MPLSKPTDREHLHTRSITYRGYRRKDGLWDIEGHMSDTKTYAFSNDWRNEIAVGEPLHEMLVRVTIDDELEIKDIEAVTDNSPFEMCPDITPNYKSLIGISIGRGWRNQVRKHVGGTKGCTHITELLFPMATVAFQTIIPFKSKDNGSIVENTASGKRPAVLNTCHAWSTESDVVKKYVPEFYTGPEDSDSD